MYKPMGDIGSEVHNLPEITHAAGEKAGLRKLDLSDITDLQRLWQIEQSPGIAMMGGSARSPEAMAQFFRKSESDTTHFYAVTGSENGGNRLPSAQHGEVEGWIRTEETTEERLRYEGVTGEKLAEDSPPVMEITYIRRPDQSMPTGLISSGVRQVCLEKLTRDLEKGAAPGIVTALIDENNAASKRVAEASGFVLKKGKIQYYKDIKGGVSNCELYVLDWNKLEQIVQGKVQPVMFSAISSVTGKPAEQVHTISEAAFEPNKSNSKTTEPAAVY